MQLRDLAITATPCFIVNEDLYGSVESVAQCIGFMFSGVFTLTPLTAIFHVDLRLPVPECLQSGFYWS